MTVLTKALELLLVPNQLTTARKRALEMLQSRLSTSSPEERDAFRKTLAKKCVDEVTVAQIFDFSPHEDEDEEDDWH